MPYATGQPVPWPVPPDWSGGVRETLTWLTERLRSRYTADTQKAALRLSPRRSFSFRVMAEHQARRVADALLFDQGVQQWVLPIWHDVQVLTAPAIAGGSTVPCVTAGYEFQSGQQALLWRSVNEWELVTVGGIAADSFTSSTGPLFATWPAGTRLYPTRLARLVNPSEESLWHDSAGDRSVTFVVDGPNDWPAVPPATTYRSYPVLELAPDWGDEPQLSYSRDIETVDGGTSKVHYTDYSGRAYQRISRQWLLGSRSAHSAFRSLLYALEGRMAVLWVPSLMADFKLAAPMAAAATVMSVEWCGYTVAGRQQKNRQDIRIALGNGTVIYRRITASAQVGATENLTLDAAPGVDLSPANVRLISFMALCEGASDAVELQHVTDASGITRCALEFEGVRHEL